MYAALGWQVGQAWFKVAIQLQRCHYANSLSTYLWTCGEEEIFCNRHIKVTNGQKCLFLFMLWYYLLDLAFLVFCMMSQLLGTRISSCPVVAGKHEFLVVVHCLWLLQSCQPQVVSSDYHLPLITISGLQSQSLQESVLGPLQICCGYLSSGFFLRFQTVGVGR